MMHLVMFETDGEITDAELGELLATTIHEADTHAREKLTARVIDIRVVTTTQTVA